MFFRQNCRFVYDTKFCLSVCPSVTLVHCVHMVRPTIIISSPYVSPTILVSADITFISKFEGGHPERGRWMRVGWVRIGDCRPISRRILLRILAYNSLLLYVVINRAWKVHGEWLHSVRRSVNFYDFFSTLEFTRDYTVSRWQVDP